MLSPLRALGQRTLNRWSPEGGDRSDANQRALRYELSFAASRLCKSNLTIIQGSQSCTESLALGLTLIAAPQLSESWVNVVIICFEPRSRDMADHVHVLARIKPVISISEFLG